MNVATRPTRPRGRPPKGKQWDPVKGEWVDAYEWQNCKTLSSHEFGGNTGVANIASYEKEPMFHAWATVQPGMVCVSRKNKTSVSRQYTAAETACPVIACAAGLPKNQEIDFFFAGIARSKSARSPSDGQGETGRDGDSSE